MSALKKPGYLQKAAVVVMMAAATLGTSSGAAAKAKRRAAPRPSEADVLRQKYEEAGCPGILAKTIDSVQKALDTANVTVIAVQGRTVLGVPAENGFMCPIPLYIRDESRTYPPTFMPEKDSNPANCDTPKADVVRALNGVVSDSGATKVSPTENSLTIAFQTKDFKIGGDVMQAGGETCLTTFSPVIKRPAQ